MTEPATDAVLDAFLDRLRGTIEAWVQRHDFFEGAALKDPMEHYNDEIGERGPVLLVCSDGEALSSLVEDDEKAQELRAELDALGVFIELDDYVTGACFLDDGHELAAAFDDRAHWRWTCKLVEADTEDVSGDLYAYFAQHPDAMRRLPSREFEKLISSIFAARGWRTELGPGTADGGVDLRVWQTDPLGDLLTLVQVKRYDPKYPIRLEAVSALEAQVERERANRGLFVTSSRYLSGVHSFAQRNKHRLQLAGPEDLRRWCEENASQARALRNRMAGPEALGALLRQHGPTPPHGVVLVGGRNRPQFCVVLKETRTSALLIHVPSQLVSGDMQYGWVVPVLDGRTRSSILHETVFRAQRSESDGRVSYWGQRTLFYPWNGKPSLDASWD